MQTHTDTTSTFNARPHSHTHRPYELEPYHIYKIFILVRSLQYLLLSYFRFRSMSGKNLTNPIFTSSFRKNAEIFVILSNNCTGITGNNGIIDVQILQSKRQCFIKPKISTHSQYN